MNAGERLLPWEAATWRRVVQPLTNYKGEILIGDQKMRIDVSQGYLLFVGRNSLIGLPYS
jgi:hypothetical protein